MVVDVLAPDRPPTVRTRFPARPPEIDVLSLLYSGESATACTGRAKFRSWTSLTSIKDAMHTFPSIEEVATYIAFEGILGTTCAFGVLGVRGVVDD